MGHGWRAGAGAGWAALALVSAGPVRAQTVGGHERHALSCSHVIVPQARGFALDGRGDAIQIERVAARIEILERAARTTLDIALRNPSGRQAEAVLLLPVPAEAAVSSFLFEGSAAEPTAVLLPREEARRTYDEIVARIKDPALLEFAGYSLIRSSVFPVPPGGMQRVRLTYEHILDAEGDRIDYALPRSESLAAQVPWRIEVDVRAQSPISMVYSPTHELETTLKQPRRVSAVVKDAGGAQPGAFLLSYLLERDGVSASLLAYPDHKVGGGYFLLMAGLPATIGDAKHRLLREVTLVIDRSGSMAGEKMDQARAAALQVIEGLADGEAFNVIDYASQVAQFAPGPVIKGPETIAQARKYLAAIRPTGGTNIHDALLEALRQPRRAGMLGIVLFVTDGLPTVGRTSEVEIRDLVASANVHARRIFTFGVGHDVNVPLLDRLSDATRATSTYVLPGEDVEVKVAQVFRRLFGPVLADLSLEVRDGTGAVTTRAIRELVPERLPDLFADDQLVLLGQYTEARPLEFRLQGNFLGEVRTFAFRFDFDRATTRNAFVPRLWATRRIAFLVDQIRQASATPGYRELSFGNGLLHPCFNELSAEILRLSTEFGILSEYTAFLATEGTDLGDWDRLRSACDSNLHARAVLERCGEAAVSQGRNFNDAKLQAQLDYQNSFWNEKNERVAFATVQQVCDRAFFQQAGQWIDARLVAARAALEPQRVVDFGSAEHRSILDRLVAEGRQGLLSLRGEILLELQGETVLVRNGPR